MTALVSVRDEATEEFKLLVAEISDQEGLSWPEAMARARELWAECGPIDADAPAVATAPRWTLLNHVLTLALLISVSVNVAFVWVLTHP